MPSPFPGMDPFLEGPLWTDFHSGFINEVRRQLAPLVMPRYTVRVEQRIYVSSMEAEPPLSSRQPDALILRTGAGDTGALAASSAVVDEPVVLTIPKSTFPDEWEPYLTIRGVESSEIVTAIELLSPTNKRSGTAGRREYLDKRMQMLGSSSNLVEIDLLRGGARLPTNEPLPHGDHYVFVSRADSRPQVAVYASNLRRRLPNIPIPLHEPDADVVLDVQAAVDEIYRIGGYQFSLNYRRQPTPPLSAEDRAWLDALLAASNGGT